MRRQKAPTFLELRRRARILRRRVAVDDDGLVEDQDAAALIVAPDALRSGIGRRAAICVTECLHRLVYPVVLIDGRLAVPLDARNEEHNQCALAAGKEAIAHAR